MSKNKLKVIMIASAFSMISFSFFSQSSFAQNAIAPDNTLPINTLVNFNSANQTYTITGGTQVGGNQFHSFQDFSVPTSNTAHFDTAPTTVNAIGRVTGSNISNIDGVLRTNGATNLYLVNPNGIVFGANAKLDIAGSFSASTANSVNFSDGSEFSATNPQAPPLLQVNMPLGLQYGNSNSGATIVNQGNLSAGQDLVLNADRLDLQGALQAGRDLTLQAQDVVTIRDTVASPFVANSGRDLTIQGNNSVDVFVLTNPLTQILSGRHLSLVSDGVISGDAHFLSGGNLSFLTTTGEVANFVSNFAAIIYANGDVTFGDYTGAALKVEATGSIQTGGIRITSPDTSGAIPINDPDFVTLTTLPSVILRAGVTSNIPQTSGGATFSFTTLGDAAGSITFGSIDTSSSIGDGGAIELTAKGDIKAVSTFLNSSSESVNSGNGGAISLSTITGDISLSGNGDDIPPFRSSSYSDSGNSGNGGAISLSTITGDISLIDLALESSSISTFGNSGNGGAISLSTITGDILFSTTGEGCSFFSCSLVASSFSNSGNSGNGGAISLSTINGDISLPFTSLGASSFSNSGNSGNSGAISLSTINGDISLPFTSLGASSFSNSGNSGNGGAISLSTINGDISSFNAFWNLESISPSGNSGNGGEISLSTVNGDISLSSILLDSYSLSDSGNSGNGGAISLSTINGDISLFSSFWTSYSYSNSGNSRNGGAISLSTVNGDISLPDTALNAYSLSVSGNSGNGGAISLFTINGDISLPNSSLYSFSRSSSGNSGSGGNVILYAIKGNILDEAFPLPPLIYSFSVANNPNSTSGDGGNVTLEVKNSISSMQIVTVSSSGSAGNATINGVGDLTISGLQISTSKTVSIPDPFDPALNLTFDVGTRGSSGDVTVTGLGSLTFDNTIINSTSQGSEPAGNISITSPTLINFQNNSQIKSSTNSTGNAGNISFTAPILNITGGSQVLAETNGDGAGGNIDINASNTINLKRILDSSPVLSVQTSNGGKAGTIVLNTPTLNLSDQARITATATATSTNTDGGGSITLNASNMKLFGTVGVFAETQGVAPAGTLFLNPYSNDTALSIALTPNSQISASTSGQGNGGNLFVTAPQSINVSGSGKLAVETTATGNAGNINFSTQNLTLTDGVLVTASTSGTGKAGDITVNANNFTLSSGAKIQTTTSGVGDSGTIKVNVANNIILQGNGTGLFADTTIGSSGNGGNINIDPEFVLLQDGAKIAVGSLGSGIGGNITLISNYLSLLNGSSITAETASTNGGNITLNIPSILLLLYGSQINTTAGTSLSGGNGGNINITAGFIVALPKENSDIFANAFTGNGGNINLTTNGIFGLEFRPVLTPLSDIAASSQFGVNGTVNINTPGVDPSKGLTNLPVDIGDASKLVSQKCLADRQDSAFVITGRGGIPASPADVISSNNLQENLGTPSDQLGNQLASLSSKLMSQSSKQQANPDRIVEAQGWTINPYGEVALVAEVPKAIPAPTWARQLQCR